MRIKPTTMPLGLGLLLVLMFLVVRLGPDFSVHDQLRPHIEAFDESTFVANKHKESYHQLDLEPSGFSLVAAPQQPFFSQFIENDQSFTFISETHFPARAPPA